MRQHKTIAIKIMGRDVHVIARKYTKSTRTSTFLPIMMMNNPPTDYNITHDDAMWAPGFSLYIYTFFWRWRISHLQQISMVLSTFPWTTDFLVKDIPEIVKDRQYLVSLFVSVLISCALNSLRFIRRLTWRQSLSWKMKLSSWMRMMLTVWKRRWQESCWGRAPCPLRPISTAESRTGFANWYARTGLSTYYMTCKTQRPRCHTNSHHIQSNNSKDISLGGYNKANPL